VLKIPPFVLQNQLQAVDHRFCAGKVEHRHTTMNWSTARSSSPPSFSIDGASAAEA
jgi:hypothetical protein